MKRKGINARAWFYSQSFHSSALDVRPKSNTTHFHSSDQRFCGSTELQRRFSLDPNEVTCEECKRKDTFVLSPSGRESLKQLGYPEGSGE